MSRLDEKGYSNYTKHKQKCPVCGHENTRAYIIEDFITIEEYYECDNCTYFYCMCFSRPIEGISQKYDRRYEDKVRELELEVMSDEDVRRLPI